MALVAENINGTHLKDKGKSLAINGIHKAPCPTIIEDFAYFETEVYEHQNGPDYIIPSSELRNWVVNGAIKIDQRHCVSGAPQPVSIPTKVKQNAEIRGDRLAMAIKRNGEWQKRTFKDVYEEARIIAKAFIKLGLKRFGSVGILGANSPEWVIGELAAVFAGGLAAGVYLTSLSDAVCYMFNDAKANIIMVDDEQQVNKVLNIQDQLPHLKAIIQWIGKPSAPGVISYEELLEMGKTVPDEILEKRLRGISINQPCLIMFTSGTTGVSKGALISHDQALYSSWQTLSHIYNTNEDDRFISYLPLNHAAAQTADVFGSIIIGYSMWFAQPDALRGTLMDTINDVRPTQFLSVPRLWEKIFAKFMQAEREMPAVKKAMFDWAKWVAGKRAQNRNKGSVEKPFLYNIARALVLKHVKAKIGFSEVKSMLSSAAPLDADIMRYFHSIDFSIYEGYGLTETFGLHTYNTPTKMRFGSVGYCAENTETKIHSTDKDGTGEILMRGRHIFMGYLNKEKETKEALTDDAWFFSGDVGYIDSEGFIYITGRKKELLITSGGENVAPVPIEEALKKQLPFVISNAVVIADKRKFLSVLLTLMNEPDADGGPTNKLTPYAQEWFRERNCNARVVEDVLNNLTEEVRNGIQEAITNVNSKAVSNACRVQKWHILPRDFSIATEELGPTMKLRRDIVVKKYKNIIDSLYDS